LGGGTVLSKYVYSQTNFAKGEIGPKSLGNVSAEEYANSVSLLENFIPHPNGGAFKRPGTVYNGTIGRTVVPYMISFITSDNKKFIITISPSGNHVSTASDVVGFYNVETGAYNTAYTIGTSLHGILTICKSLNVYDFNYAQSGNVVVVTHASGLMQPILIKYVGDDARYSASVSFVWGFWSTLESLASVFNLKFGTMCTTVPYVDRNITSLTFTPNAVPATSAITASVNFFTGSMIGSYVRISNGLNNEGVARINSTNLTITCTVDLGTNVFTAASSYTTGSEVVITGSSYIPRPLQPGKVYYAINVSGTSFRLAYTYADAIAGTAIDLVAGDVLGTIYATYNIPAAIAYVTPIIPYPAASASDNWTISAFSDYMGWPKTCAFFEGRLIFGGTNKNAGTIYASLLNNIVFFMQARFTQDYQAEDVEKAGTAVGSPSGIGYIGYLKVTDPFSFTIASNESNAIKWINSGKSLFVGTVAGEGIISGGDQILSYNNVKVSFFTSVGSASVQPKKIDQSLLFVALNGQGVRDFIYYDSNGSYVAMDLCALNDQIVHHNYVYTTNTPKIKNRFLQMAYDSTNSILWLLTSNFQLVGISYNRQTNTMAWHRHTLGGLNAKVKGICCIYDSVLNYNKLMLNVERTINSVTVSTFEYLNFYFDEEKTSHGLMSYLDCSMPGYINAGGIGLNKASGFAPLLGDTISLIVAGKLHPNEVVGAAGVVTLDANFVNGDLVIGGYGYTSKMKLNPIQAGGDFGFSLGTLHRTDRITVRFFKSIGLQYSWNDVVYDDLFDENNTITNVNDLTLFSGEKTEYIENDHVTYNQIYFKHDVPFPCNVLNITQRGVSYGG
jgi:hypothetical protein